MPIEPWRARHPLESPIWKIRRALKHIETMNTHLSLWESLEPDWLERHLNSEGSHFEYTLVARYPPLIDIGTAIGEFAYQLRSALDQIVYALAVFPSTLSADALAKAERSTSFPIMLERNDKRIRDVLRYVPNPNQERAYETINLVQPYHRTPPEVDPLALLDQMNIQDKHRVLQPAVGGLRFDGAGMDPSIKIAKGSVRNGELIARVPVTLDPERDFERRVSRRMTIPISRPPGGIEIHQVGEIYSCVAFDVLPRFVDLFDPLPPTVAVPTPADS